MARFRILNEVGSLNTEALADMGNGYAVYLSVVVTTNKTTVAYSTTTVTLLAARVDYSRMGAVVINGGTQPLQIQDGPLVQPGDRYSVEDATAPVDGYWTAAGSGSAYVFEWVL